MGLPIRTIRELFVVAASILKKHNDRLLKSYTEGLGELADCAVVSERMRSSWESRPETRGKKYKAWRRERVRLMSARRFLDGDRRTKLEIVRASMKVKRRPRGNPLNLYTRNREGRKLPVCVGQYISFEVVDDNELAQGVGRVCLMPREKGGCYQVESFYSSTPEGLGSIMTDVLPEQVLEVYSKDPATYLPLYEEVEAQYAADLEAYWTARIAEAANLTDDELDRRIERLAIRTVDRQGKIKDNDIELELLNREYERRNV